MPFGGGAFATRNKKPLPLNRNNLSNAFRRGGFRHAGALVAQADAAENSPMPFGGGAFATRWK